MSGHGFFYAQSRRIGAPQRMCAECALRAVARCAVFIDSVLAELNEQDQLSGCQFARSDTQ